ncbi:hypothetical protein QBC33DRAFT_248557 [Phialemonium atrogriseum]|uniref:Uncharacterized protein n=1 Tax=Phialemonium atrogriseum TaxID=1093897 RepID=A0AAJ0FDI1_9PEZI|nr:uncharacterized protein QBC33DRAFT_248557 [Phialemonium atrogriseum]KAK1763272.1 hypothetical protein QBC33DRAFT_248557 [Phialemonium atrogriseum]
MRTSTLLSFAFFGAAIAAPLEEGLAKRQGDRGSYTVSGLGARKQAVQSAGGNTLDLAIAMLETDTMTTTYTYGDGKTSDSANFGIFKQNWGMLRECASQFKGQSTGDWNNGAVLNSNLQQDVSARHECENFYGRDKWFAGHRNGASGLSNPNTQDINNYKNAVLWIQQQIDGNSQYKTDDTRFWVNVPAI